MRAVYNTGVRRAPEELLERHPLLARLRPEQVALPWVLRHPEVTSVITGASRASQVVENMKALDVIPLLTDDVKAEIEAAVS